MPSIPPIKSARIRRWLARAAFAVAVLLTLVAGFYAVEKLRGNAAWKAYQADALARGVKLTLADYIPAPVPDERNFAAIPVFQDAFKEPPPPDPFNLAQKSGGNLPAFDSVVKNRPIDLHEWQKYFVETKRIPAAGNDAAADVLTALQPYAPLLDQLHTAGARPGCFFPIHYEDGISTRLPHLSLFQHAAQLLALRMAAHLAQGQSDAAYEDFHDGLRLYTATAAEPTLVAGLVRLGVLGIVENGVWGGLVRRQWNEKALREIPLDLAEARLMDDYAHSLGSERGFSNVLHDQLAEKSTGELAALLSMAHGPANNRAAYSFYSLYPTGWLRMSQARNNRYIDEMLARVSQDPPRIHTDRAVPSEPRRDESLLDRTRYMIFFLLAPALGEIEHTYAYNQTLLDQTRLGCALERYRLTHESYPSTLDTLVPDYLPAIPGDVMTGEPLHYRVTADGGYQLYAVGANRRDDGGRTDPKLGARQQPDWVWNMR
jgi:hypothetical protein